MYSTLYIQIYFSSLSDTNYLFKSFITYFKFQFLFLNCIFSILHFVVFL